MEVERLVTNNAYGVQWCGEEWAFASLNQSKNGLSIQVLERGDDVKRLYKLSQEQSTSSEDSCLVSSLPTEHTLIRPLNLRLKKLKEIDEVLSFQADPLLPCPVEGCVLDRFILELGEESRLSIVAAQHKEIEQHLQLYTANDLEPELISCTPAALAAFAHIFCPTDKALVVIHLGKKGISFILAQQGKVLQSRALSCDNPSFFSLKPHELTQLEEADLLRKQVTQNLMALKKQVKTTLSHEVLLCGPGSQQQDFAEFILNGINLPKAKITKSELSPADIQIGALLDYAVPIGLALTALDLELPQINLRKEPFAYPNRWKRLLKPISTYLFLCLFLSFSLFLWGNSRINYLESDLKENYLSLLTTLNKSPEGLEEEFQKKQQGSRFSLDKDDFFIEDLSIDDIQERVDFLESQLKSIPESFPLYPNVPRVADVLAWISQHPKVVRSQEEGSIQEALIRVESFAYNMTKRPDQNRKNERYRVKVELEFSTPSPTVAREFHDALIENNAIIDQKNEIKWSTSRGKYKTAFFLKDKTVYSRSGRGETSDA